MRRALQTLDPRKNPQARRRRACATWRATAILQSFYALRETFLEELDLEEPDHPLLISGGRTGQSKSGSTGRRAAGKSGSASASRTASTRRVPIPHRSSCWPNSMQKEEQTAETLATTGRKRPGSRCANGAARLLNRAFSGRAT